MNKQKLYIVISSIVGILAAFMPWVSVSAFKTSFLNVAGVDGDGKISLVLFIVALVLCLVGNREQRLSKEFTYILWGVSGVNMIIFFVLLSNANRYGQGANVFGAGVHPAHGAYLTFLAALAIILFSMEQLNLVEKVEKLFKGKSATQDAVSETVEKVVVPVEAVVTSTSETKTVVEEQVKDVPVNPVDVPSESIAIEDEAESLENVDETEATVAEEAQESVESEKV